MQLISPRTIILRFFQFVPKRILFLLTSLTFFSIGFFLILVKGEGTTITYNLLVSLLPLFMLLLSLSFGIRKQNLFKIVLMPSLLVISSYLLLSFFPNLNTFFKFSFIVFTSLVLYFMLLSLNVFLVVEEKGSTIPLIRPARTTFLLLEIYTFFLFVTSLYKVLLPDPLTEATFLFQFTLVFLITYFFAQAYWWSQNLESDISSFVGNESLTVAFFVLVIAISLSFFSTESFFRALSLVATYYVSINFIESVVTHKFIKSQYWEYFLITLLIILFLILE
ncbi:MAG TPA: hypothetical protein ENJ78_00185 [candidate division WWE3 bacterium]|uniref:Uncharacterized protein n=1 Tax=candidate division WWE3 bacterium TaxID=2053526 RepID=A0A7V5J144_UNCKA|nr:hypothetical protein [candidate division WWE3 bacterium]